MLIQLYILWVVNLLTVHGQDVGFSYENSCYNEKDTMVIKSSYTGSGTVNIAEWFYTGGTTHLLILASTCTVFGGAIPSGFPDSSRMTYQCDTSANEYSLTLTGLLDDELKNKEWGATFSLASGPSPSVNKTEISICATTPAPTPDPCTVGKWWNILPIIGAILFAIGIVLIIIPLVWKLECIEKHGQKLAIVEIILYVLGLILIIPGLAGASSNCCTYWWMIVLLVVALIITILRVLYHLGYLPGRWSDTVLIPEKDYPRIKFEDVLSWVKRKKIMEETQAQIFICGEGSDKYENPGGQDACLCLKSLPDDDQPLQAYVTACLKISVKRAVLKIKELHEAFTTQAVNSVEPRPLPEPKGPPATRLQPIPPKM